MACTVALLTCCFVLADDVLLQSLIVARLNFSHGDHAGHGAVLERIRQAARNKMRNVAIMLDTKGPEIRSGFFANDAKKIDLVKGETLTLTTVSGGMHGWSSSSTT